MNRDTSRPGTAASIAVVGCGSWGRNLVRNHAELGSLQLVCDSNETVLSQLQAQYPHIRTCLSSSGVLSDLAIKGVVIATPAETHFSLAREFLLAGKHVYVEKPLALDDREGEDLVNLSKDQGLVLMVGHLLQYHPVFIRLKELAASGCLGRINYIYSHRLNLGKIRREENALWSFAPHDISMILSLTGEQPESVLATGGNYLHRRIADVTTTHIEFPSGIKAHVFVSWLHPFKDQKLVVVGDRKMAVFDDTAPWPDKLLLYPHEIVWKDHIPVPSRREPERVIDIPEQEPLRLECEHFLHCISNGTRPLTDGQEGLRVLQVLNASQRSLNQNGAKISLTASVLGAAEQEGMRTLYDIHKTAVVDEGCEIGSGTKIWHFSHVLKGCRIGDNCNIGQNVVIGPDVTIGNRCKIQNNVSVYPGVTLEDGVFCGPSMVFTNVFNPRAEIRKMDQLRPTLIRRGATIGANATIVCGHTIGEHAFVGAGAVVTKDVTSHSLVTGNPARHAGWVCRCGERLMDDLLCSVCGTRYRRTTSGIAEERLS
jgi:UDP-2-acetamido-3-amino-2,3-dideoxy-glucuronate N-acetyltransferase